MGSKHIPKEFWIELKNMCAFDIREKPAAHRPAIHVIEATPEVKRAVDCHDELVEFLNDLAGSLMPHQEIQKRSEDLLKRCEANK